MRWYLGMPSLMLSISLGACAQLLGSGPTVDDRIIVPRVAACNSASDTPKAANDYMQIGFANVYAACEAFFVDATRFQQNALATNQTLDSGLIGATSIITATSSAASAVKAITITTAGIVMGKSLLNNYTTTYAFGTHLYKVRQLVQNDMDNYAAKVAPPDDTCIAYANVQKLATKCTLANMQALLDAQVAIPSQISSPATIPPAALTKVFRAKRVLPGLQPFQSSPPVSSTVVPVQQ
ncbi:hypothetical protein X747_28725 [Mesorhizobium sp. LNJC384A00]|uniref:hypothetical protein n=1 Tax=Mesorhizobium sp. LNJC384A00 TaxID=1287268 RepID=UPI0003CEA786|nr:hypothetical protein [Mesorhizobium sp. LNJC384A00]ESY35293.1 hypothetical protein X747_28725 [Mesorhizobium sp. LNJC384A00]